MDPLLLKFDSSTKLFDSTVVKKTKSDDKLPTVSVNGYLKKLNEIKRCLIENDWSSFKDLLKDIESPDKVLSSVSKSQSSQIRLIIADLMHDSISMEKRELFIIGLAKVFNVNEQNKLGFIPLHLAVARGKLKVACILVKHGSQIDLQNEQGRCPLHVAVLKGHQDVVNFLLACGANPNICDNELWTPLHWACRQHNIEIIKLLLTNGARLDLQTDQKKLPLDMAFGANYNPSEFTWHPMSAWNLIVHGACRISDKVFQHWLSDLLPKLILSDEYQYVMSQLLVLMCKAGILSPEWIENIRISLPTLRKEHVDEALEWSVKPGRLSQLCRIRVRCLLYSNCGGKSIVSSASQLPLPKSVRQFVLLKG